MKISARNQFSGTVKNVVRGPVSAEVTITVAPGIDVVAVISAGSAQSLGLAAGKPAHVLIKATSVLVGVD
ncbi:MAG TPA: TOBE domain-containing protein [Casimicrobiaceae bacterium]|nr:TOBE domain-containing protein [Casimicrobiaceae bacterium]